MENTISARIKPAAAKRNAPTAVLWPILGIALLLAANLLINPGFLRIEYVNGHFYGGPIDILNQGARPILLALGMTFVIATGGVDLSVGAVMAIAGSVAAIQITQSHASVLIILAGSVLVGLAAGFINGILVAGAKIQPIIATLILMVAGRGISQLITGGQVITFQDPAVEFLGSGFLAGVPFSILIVLLLYVLTHLFVRRTALGLFIEAVGDNETASRFTGLHAARVKIMAYVFCGVCAGITGLMATANIKAADSYRVGENMELDAIFAVVVGGTALAGGRFSILGSFAGALLLQTLTITMYNIGIPPAIAPVPKALLIIIVCLVQSDLSRHWLKGLLKGKPA